MDTTLSVIMSIYNEKLEWINDSISSILIQNFRDFEFIIVNDNPDRLENEILLNKYKLIDDRIHIINNEKNLGLTKSLNIALKQAKGKYIARMDADDISHPHRFQKQVQFMESHPDCVVCGTQIQLMTKKKTLFASNWIKKEDSTIRIQLLFGNSFAHPTVFIRHSTLKKNQILYDEQYIVSQDYRLWEQLWDCGQFHNLGKKLLRYRLSALQISSQKNKIQNKFAFEIKNRLRNKWLEKLEYNGINLSDIRNIHHISIFKGDIKGLLSSKQDYKIYKRLLMEFYFSLDSNMLNFRHALVSKDIFLFSLRKVVVFFIHSFQGK